MSDLENNKVDFRKLTLELIENANIENYDDLNKDDKKKIYNKYYHRIYRKYNKEKKAKQNKKYRDKNRIECNKASLDWYNKNRERMLVNMRNNYYKRKAKKNSINI